MLIADTARARSASKSYAKQWLSKADGKTIGEAARAANRDSLPSLHRIGVTESSQAYSEAKRIGAKSVPVKLYRVWDAVLDKRTCFVCSGADGDITGIRERFSSGEPGSVHPNCRCTWSVLAESETNSRYLIEAA
jgi:hypothetical protein